MKNKYNIRTVFLFELLLFLLLTLGAHGIRETLRLPVQIFLILDSR
jgi:hypothetical protein